MREPHAMATETTLRDRISELSAQGRPLDVGHAIGLLVPLAVELADQHRQGYTFFVYPSALFLGQDDHYHASALSASPPTDPRDVACLPPEAGGTSPGQNRASVYAIGAMLYELVTLQSVGPNMRRPSELVPGFPAQLEAILAKALVGDPAHRPDDLNALAQALYQINNSYSEAPPPADVGHLDHDDGFDVDVSLSMLPPAPKMQVSPTPAFSADAPLPPGVRQAAPVSRGGAQDLLSVKARLEADRRPRYVVVKDGMDHGPFVAVELLQQIASHTFVEGDVLRDSIDQSELSIGEHPDFAQFARHARLGRQEKAEKVAIQQAVIAESRSTKGKATLGLLLVGVAVAGVLVWVFTSRGAKKDEIAVVEEVAANVESDANLKTASTKKSGGKRVTGTVNGIPQLGGGMSCEAAQSAYVEEMKMGPAGQADLTAGQFNAILGNGSYLNACGVPGDMGVKVCAAVQNGRAVGVTVTTNPKNAGLQSCIASKVRGMSFPVHPKLDVARTSF